MATKTASKTPSAPAVDRAASCSPSVVITVPLDTPESSIAELRAAGFLAVKTDEPEKVRIVSGPGQVVGDDLLMSVMEGLMMQWQHNSQEVADKMRARALGELHRRLKLREASEANISSADVPKTSKSPQLGGRLK